MEQSTLSVKALAVVSEAVHTYRMQQSDGISRFLAIKSFLQDAGLLSIQRSLVYPDHSVSASSLSSTSSSKRSSPRSKFPSLKVAVQTVAELARIDCSIALVIAGNMLGTIPILTVGSAEQIAIHLARFHNAPPRRAMPLACLALSEPHGSANFMEPHGPGLRTVALLKDGVWHIDGEKVWSTSIAGWEQTGPDLICLVCRDLDVDHEGAASSAASLLMLIVPHALLNPENFVIKAFPVTPGLTATCGPHVIFRDLCVPDRPEYVLARGGNAAVALQEVSKRGSVVAAAMSLGVSRCAISEAAKFARSQDRGRQGRRPIIETESSAHMLSQLMLRCAVSEELVSAAASKIDISDPNARQAALQAKVHASEETIQCVLECSRLVGVSSYDTKESRLSDLLMDAMGMPLIAGSNTMIRKTLAAMVK